MPHNDPTAPSLPTEEEKNRIDNSRLQAVKQRGSRMLATNLDDGISADYGDAVGIRAVDLEPISQDVSSGNRLKLGLK